MSKKYAHRTIEPKWQKQWKASKAGKVADRSDKPKYYVLDMWPYPSGAGLHVGHVVGYTATDIVARYKKQKGFNVLHPMGWDAFGLPAEQYAVRTGQHPAVTTKKNIETYKRQLDSLGFMYDWDREVSSTDPDYYKWTQWIFTVLFERGLAYEAEMLVNWCPALGTVLANEEVEDGLSTIGGHPVERRPLKQWILKITDYAERLLHDLDKLDWPDHIKRLQANWIGKSTGTEIYFELEDGQKIVTFTTRPDTLFGVTYVVLAPEHPLVSKITTEIYQADVERYQKEAAAKSDLDRTELSKEKSGVFTGAYAINPVTEERIPVWISDYVLAGYGTGAVQAVPSHDARDFEFANEFSLPLKAVILPHDEQLADEVKHHKACWTDEGTLVHSAHDDLDINGLSCAKAAKAVTAWLEKNHKGKATINYKLRDWLFSRQRYWGEPIPILHFEDGTKRALELDELPLCPPAVEDYKPTEEGLSPLAKVTDWVEVSDSKTGHAAKRETNTMPQWAGSSWYYLRFLDPTNDQQMVNPELEQIWMPVDLYIGGAEHAVLHLLYARFWHKVLHDAGYISTDEPFKKLFNQGLVLAHSYKKPGGGYVEMQEGDKNPEGLIKKLEKMSKSKLNVVTPDEIIEEFGADALRLYEMFMGPLDKEKIWNTDNVTGCYRFLSRFYDLATGELSDGSNDAALKLGHKTVAGVAEDIEQLQLNTAIAKMMTFVNDFSKLEERSKCVIAMVTQVLAPFAPHIAEEIWEHLGHNESIFDAPWPEVNEAYLQAESITYVVQVNGKLRGRFDLPVDQTQETIVGLAKEQPEVAKYLVGDIRKVIFVPNKLLNFVVAPPKT